MVVPGTAPIPILAVAMRVVIFDVPEIFTLVVKMLEVVSAFEI